jgi:hypothetical protein
VSRRYASAADAAAAHATAADSRIYSFSYPSLDSIAHTAAAHATAVDSRTYHSFSLSSLDSIAHTAAADAERYRRADAIASRMLAARVHCISHHRATLYTHKLSRSVMRSNYSSNKLVAV